MKRRRPWIAFLLTQICPGLGQLYNGDLRWTLIAFLASFLLASFSIVYLFDSLTKLLWAIGVGLLGGLVLSVQAYLKARRLGEVRLAGYQRWWVYLLFTAVVYGVPDGYGVLIPSRIRSFQIPSESMVPNLLVGDRLVADGWSYWHAEPRRGDIVVFDYPRDPGTKFVKRLIGVPGDVVEIREGELFLNGHAVEKTATGRTPETDPRATEYLEKLEGVEHTLHRTPPMNTESFPALTVPPAKLFMMGDNRDRSSDSRFWGFVARDQVIGRMEYIYFSWDSKAYERVREEKPADLLAAIRAGIRWDRIGKRVR